MLQRTKHLLGGSLAVLPFLLGPAAANAQYNRNNDFYNGARDGGHGGGYDRGGYHDGGNNYGNNNYGQNNYGNNNDGHNDQYHGHGVGAGRGALIGGGVGAAAGAIFGGGLKGALIGGGAGAGIGAFAGHEHQEGMKHRYYDRRRGGYYYR